MSKSILGDDPFAPKPATAEGDEAQRPAATARPVEKAAKAKAPAKAKGKGKAAPAKAAAASRRREPAAAPVDEPGAPAEEATLVGEAPPAVEEAATAVEEAVAVAAAAVEEATAAVEEIRSAVEETRAAVEERAATGEEPAIREAVAAGPAAEAAVAAHAHAPEETDAATTPASADAGYGPSIDRTATHGERRGLADDLARAERVAGSERRRLPLEPLWRGVRALAMRDRSLAVDEFGRDPTVERRIAPALEFLYRRWFRVDAQGLGHIPDAGRALLVANHSGALPYDAGMLMHAVRHEHAAHREVRPLVEDFVFHFPYLGTLMNRIGGVRACPENATRLLEADELVAVFPEGIKGIGKLYRERYRLQRFGRGGFIKLALATDAPIIPTAIVGAEEIHPMLTKLTWLTRSIGVPYLPITPTFPWLGPIGLVPLPTKWTIAFGAPLYFGAEYGPEAASDRILVNRLAEQVRQRIQEMIDALLSQRRGLFS